MSSSLRPGVPLHEQISDHLRQEIEEGDLQPHDQLPSEAELCRIFEVSRVTVRRALQTLEADGLIYRRQGLGSFVCDRRVRQGLVRLTDFAQDMERAGIAPSSRVLLSCTEPASAAVARELGIEDGRPVMRLDRLRLGDGEPVALDRTWLPPFYAQLLEGHDLARHTIYGILEREYDVPIVSGRYRLTATSADEELARALQVSRGDALLLIERTSRTAGQRAVYFQKRFYRPDRVTYEMELAREGGEATREDGLPLREFEPVFRPSSENG